MPLGANKAAIMGVAGVSTGDVVLLNTITATSDSEISFTSGLTSTYGQYIFGFYNINPETDMGMFGFNGSIDGGSNYNLSKTTTFFRARHVEDDSATHLDYDDNMDFVGTGYARITGAVGNGADESFGGVMQLFNPASTTYVKHFITRTHLYDGSDQARNTFMSGYINTTSAVNAIDFKFESGDFDGTIKMWGVK